MYTVKKVTKGEVIKYQEINVGIIKGIMTVIRSDGFAIVNSSGELHTSNNRLTGVQEYEIYSLKNVAQKEADFYNSQN